MMVAFTVFDRGGHSLGYEGASERDTFIFSIILINNNTTMCMSLLLHCCVVSGVRLGYILYIGIYDQAQLAWCPEYVLVIYYI